MADPRTDFFAQDPDTSTTPGADPRTAFFASGGSAALSKKSARLPLEDPINAAVGGFVRQSAASVGAGVAGGLRGLYDVASGKGMDTAAEDTRRIAGGSLGYQPVPGAEAAGAAAAGSSFNPLNWPGMALNWAGKKMGATAEAAGAPPWLSTALEVAPTAAAMSAEPIRRANFAPYEVSAENPTPTAGQIASNTVQNSPQSLGAAAAAPRVTNASPQLQQAIVAAAQKTGGAINPDAMARHLEADSLPVPVQLTEGQALQDPTRISTEQNLRGQHQEIAGRFAEQNGQLAQNLQALRDEVGPDVFTTNAIEHGDTLIKAYQDKAAAADADTGAKYRALRDANGGQFPVDAKQLLSNVQGQLHQKLLYEHAPTELSQLQGLAEKGSMSFEQFEAMRTNLARTMRSSSDGNERAAAGIIRQQMEQLPLSGETAKLKPLADAARSAAKAQFDALEADPAYKAAVNGLPPDQFVRKFVTGGTRDNVALMRRNLADNPAALQTMGVATIDSLRDAAGIKPDGTGNFTQAGFNKQRLALDPKLKSLLSPEQAETVEKLGNVARYTQAQPRGAFVNNSNTFVAAAANHAAGLAEGVLNAKAGGIPLGSMARNALSKRAQKSAVRNMLKPGAGLDVLESP